MLRGSAAAWSPRWDLQSHVLSGSDEHSYIILKRKEDRGEESSTSTEPNWVQNCSTTADDI